jgi:DNA-damage-inducible protein J
MTANTVVRARIDEKTKKEAGAVLAAMGFTISDAFRILLVRVAKDKVFPFEPLIPNKKTIAAMKAAREGKLVKVNNVDHLLDSLNEDDSIH